MTPQELEFAQELLGWSRSIPDRNGQLRCFFHGPACTGEVKLAGGARDRGSLGLPVFEERTAYCETHRRAEAERARWNGFTQHHRND